MSQTQELQHAPLARVQFWCGIATDVDETSIELRVITYEYDKVEFEIKAKFEVKTEFSLLDDKMRISDKKINRRKIDAIGALAFFDTPPCYYESSSIWYSTFDFHMERLLFTHNIGYVKLNEGDFLLDSLSCLNAEKMLNSTIEAILGQSTCHLASLPDCEDSNEDLIVPCSNETIGELLRVFPWLCPRFAVATITN